MWLLLNRRTPVVLIRFPISSGLLKLEAQLKERLPVGELQKRKVFKDRLSSFSYNGSAQVSIGVCCFEYSS